MEHGNLSSLILNPSSLILYPLTVARCKNFFSFPTLGFYCHSLVVIDSATGVQFCCSKKEQAGQVSLGQRNPDPPEFEGKPKLQPIR
jgi:hypothetical protein